MISELDIIRAANVVIEWHGVDARIAASRMVDRILDLGDLEGWEAPQLIKRAIEVLQGSRTALLH